MTTNEIHDYLIKDKGLNNYDANTVSTKLFGADKETVDKYTNYIGGMTDEQKIKQYKKLYLAEENE